MEKIREYPTGATRSALGDKLQYEGYLNPMVLHRFAQYMKLHQTDAAGNTRAADNWQLGLNVKDILDSKTRHDIDIWLHGRGYAELATEDLETACCAVMFNTMALLKHVLDNKVGG